MTIDTLRGMLLWSGILNYAVLVVWALAVLWAREPLRRIGRWYGVSGELFDALNYGGLMSYKLAIILFNLGPYLALRIIG
jgi:hypothetical protein